MEAAYKLKFDQIVSALIKRNHIHGAVFRVQNLDKTLDISSAAGNLNAGSNYFIASINKLIISAIVLRFHEQGTLDLQQKLIEFFEPHETKGMLVFKEIDYTSQITIQHLLSQTSGFPCYLIDKGSAGVKNMNLLKSGNDQSWPLEKVMNEMKVLKPKYIPGSKGRANYSETNFILLAAILERLTGKKISELFHDLFDELGMKNTFSLPSCMNTAPVYYKAGEISLQKYWATTGHNVSSTVRDQMIFLRAFFEGYFFPVKKLEEYKEWNRIFMPFQYGVGMQRVNLPKILSPFHTLPEVIGHCGSAGSVAFKFDSDLYITGTVNQSAAAGVAIQTIYKIYRLYRKVVNER